MKVRGGLFKLILLKLEQEKWKWEEDQIYDISHECVCLVPTNGETDKVLYDNWKLTCLRIFLPIWQKDEFGLMEAMSQQSGL